VVNRCREGSAAVLTDRVAGEDFKAFKSPVFRVVEELVGCVPLGPLLVVEAAVGLVLGLSLE
jgi:hypothetical protein